jgi:hypothetical protein
MKILLQTTESKKIDINLPFYGILQEDYAEIHVMVDEKEFKQITIEDDGRFEILKYKSPKYLAEIWYSNQSSESIWQEALDRTKNYINSF